MADKKFSQFTVATTATDASLAGLQDGENVLIPSSLLIELINAIPLTGTEVGNPVTGPIGFGVGGQNIARGTFDNGTGGDNGISLNCAVGYELNWQGGKLSVKTGSTIVPFDCRPYKVYTALLTQNGGSVPSAISSGNVTKGVTYMILGDLGDYSNVGAPNNNDGTFFVAINNEVPITFGDSELEYNTGAPVVTVLENTIGNIWFIFYNDGWYNINSTSLFTENKTFVFFGSVGDSDLSAGYTSRNFITDSNIIGISSFVNTNTNLNGLLDKTSLEIRVYN